MRHVPLAAVLLALAAPLAASAAVKENTKCTPNPVFKSEAKRS